MTHRQTNAAIETGTERATIWTISIPETGTAAAGLHIAAGQKVTSTTGLKIHDSLLNPLETFWAHQLRKWGRPLDNPEGAITQLTIPQSLSSVSRLCKYKRSTSSRTQQISTKTYVKKPPRWFMWKRCATQSVFFEQSKQNKVMFTLQ